ncbi:hypothetical protein RFI_03313 [Reticulomyxa filosa]|uniref:Fe2OG dioxygenase domain-containing protein n=1 Tax=Reticulomyxa filosa TaxID=46433 RepID=X6P6Q2_RETFI|nr:hypothetical protein RFI_03313 [Reticulomyxa filosa]|eukprot:ETO33788.1 hypothetical protein RFI_03313 [Reticulomyxa filosa]
MSVLFLLYLFVSFVRIESINFVEVTATGETQTYEEQQDAFAPVPVAVVIKNGRSSWVDYYWENPETKELVYQGKIDPRGTTATSSYVGHVFVFTPMKKSTKKAFARIEIKADKNLYILPLGKKNRKEKDLKYYQSLLEEEIFVEEYKKKTGKPIQCIWGGNKSKPKKWLAHYPRSPPILHMWSANHVGQTHHVTSNEYYWTCIPDDITDANAVQQCRDNKPLSITLQVLSTDPKVFQIDNVTSLLCVLECVYHTKVLSEVEADLVISLAKPKIKRSLAGTHGGLVSNTRTSKNTWIDRNEHAVMETLYRRAADILNVSESILYPTKNVEQLQVVIVFPFHQQKQHKLNMSSRVLFASHHDFGADGNPQQRMITLLFYLNNQASPNAGGETIFPKAKDGPLKAHPGKGNAVLFYSMLEDGNADDSSLHAALPVKEGEKWIGMSFPYFRKSCKCFHFVCLCEWQ